MHHQIARLVDDHDIIIFVNDVQRNIFGFKRRRFLLNHLFNDNRHPRFNAEVLGDFATADLDFARFNQLLHVCAGDIFHNADKELVDTFTIMLFFYDIIHFSGRGFAALRYGVVLTFFMSCPPPSGHLLFYFFKKGIEQSSSPLASVIKYTSIFCDIQLDGDSRSKPGMTANSYFFQQRLFLP